MPLPLAAGLILSSIASQIVDGATDIASDIAVDSLSNALSNVNFGNGNTLGSMIGNQIKFRASAVANAQIMGHSMSYANKLESHFEDYRESVKTKIASKKTSAKGKILNAATLGKLNKGLAEVENQYSTDANQKFKNYIDSHNTALNRASTFSGGNRALKNTYDYSSKRVEDMLKVSDPNIIKLINALGYVPSKSSSTGAI